MPRIQPLQARVINQIAAGEVIERPASVIKELLENSVDALATRIDVDIVAGGTELIRVVDDGEGIHPDDLELAVTSHATSKVETAEDLFRIRTMGFRGEALASIASISRMRIRSRQPSSDVGYEINIDGGIAQPTQLCGGPPGTLIEVHQLFANTPVRRKFLKTAATEFGHISEQFARIALAHPRLHAVLRHNKKTVYELPATDQLLERLQLFYGADLAKKLIPIESTSGDVHLWGYVAHPSHSKSTRKGQYLFLNGRWIQDRALQHALTEAYRGLLMTGRHPVVFLFLEIPPETVDVNVHPAKSEVRFQDGQQLYRQLLSSLRAQFLSMELDSEISLPPRNPPADNTAATGSSTGNATTGSAIASPEQQRTLQIELADWAKGQLNSWQPQPPNTTAESATETTDEITNGTIGKTTAATEFTTNAPTENNEHVPQYAHQSTTAPNILQVLDCYLIVESDDGMAVIDQHALHERVMYEQLRNRVLNGSVESQRLLVPESVDMGADEAAALIENRELLRQLGFGIDEFGGNTILLTAYPPMLSRADHAQLLRDLAEQILGAGQNPTRRDILDELLHMMSCKAAVKAGQRLTANEMETLLAQRHLIDDAHHCPHGRPTALILSRAELDRQFGRLG